MQVAQLFTASRAPHGTSERNDIRRGDMSALTFEDQIQLVSEKVRQACRWSKTHPANNTAPAIRCKRFVQAMFFGFSAASR